MIILDYPVNFKKSYFAFRMVWNKEKYNKDEIMNQDLLKFYEAKANLLSERWDDSDKRDSRILMKVINAIITFEELDKPSPYKTLI